jgi:branched-chain amino acid transport system substrate-binding protein
MARVFFMALGLLMFSFLSCEKDDVQEVETIKIGALNSITGNWSSLGKTSKEAMAIALQEVNAYLENKNSAYRFAGEYYDTKLDVTEAKNAIQTGINSGIRIFIGPQSSAEVSEISSMANSNNILVVSQGSTASSMAIANDAIFRYCPVDVMEGAAIAKTMYGAGKQIVITVARNDAGNIGLQTSVGNTFKSLGGQVDAIAPYATTLTDYSALVSMIKAKIEQYSTASGASKVAVYAATFDEVKDIFKKASTDPVLSTVNWYGGDGIVQSSVLVSDAEASAFSVRVGFFAPNFGLPAQAHPDLARIKSSILAKTGIEPDAYALSVYDAVWTIALTVDDNPGVLQDFSKMKTAFMETSYRFFGITGPTMLDDKGDRKIGTFDYWGIENENGTYKWKLVGKSS